MLALAFALRAYHLDYQSLWSDEGISLLRATQPLPQLIREMPVEHLPGYFVLLHFWLRLAGDSDFALRFLSLWPGILAIVLTYRLGADLGDRLAGIIAAVLLATNSFQVWYAQEARMYTWLLAASLGSTWLFWQLLFNLDPRRQWAVAFGYALTTAMALYLHYYGFLVPIAHGLFLTIWLWRIYRLGASAAFAVSLRAAGRWALAAMAAALLFVPWLPRALYIFEFPGWRPPADPRQIPWRYLAAYTVGDAMPEPWRAWLPWLYLVLTIGGVLAWWRRREAASLLLVTNVVMPLGAAIALALRDPDFHERYTIIISAPLILLAAGGLAKLWIQPLQRGVRLMGTIVLIGLLATNGLALRRLYADSSLHKPDFRGAAWRIQQWEQPGDVILMDGPDPQKVFLHYYRGRARIVDLRFLQNATPQQVDAALRSALQGATRAWGVLYFHGPGPVQAWLAAHGWPAAETDHNGIRVTLYGLPTPAAALAERSLYLDFGPHLILIRAEVDSRTALRAGELLRLTTYWLPVQPLPDLKFSLRLQDAAARVWLAEDYMPQDWFAPTSSWQPGQVAFDRHGLLLPPDLPPGPYRVTLRVYDPATGVPLETERGPDALLQELWVQPAWPPPIPEALEIPRPVALSLNGDLTLLGFAITPSPLRPGQPGELSLWWRVERVPMSQGGLRIELLDRRGVAWTIRDGPISMSPLELWQPGQIMRERYSLAVDPALESGRYRLRLTLADGSPSMTLSEVSVQARARRYRLPRMAHPIDARLGDAVILRGYDVMPALPVRGGLWEITLYWQAKARLSISYKVFVHLYDAAGSLRAQVDDYPLRGEAPTSSWLPGEVVVDRYQLLVPSDLPPGVYRLAVGLYDPTSGQRLPAQDVTGQLLQDNAIFLREVEVP
ncbi:MAG: glycosyltransferase family 39 protein [Anaerolineae bacterium]|nr:glycosyltransferase family 39 protein [Anaerolineae bacterium]MDW8100395.1 glycosyltransferase family 39 protein [Anaerolineae bacterium]